MHLYVLRDALKKKCVFTSAALVYKIINKPTDRKSTNMVDITRLAKQSNPVVDLYHALHVRRRVLRRIANAKSDEPVVYDVMYDEVFHDGRFIKPITDESEDDDETIASWDHTFPGRGTPLDSINVIDTFHHPTFRRMLRHDLKRLSAECGCNVIPRFETLNTRCTRLSLTIASRIKLV